MQKTIQELEAKANWVRNRILEMIVSAGKGHIGGALSCTDILVALYYGGIIHFDANSPDWSERDRFIMSKGHSGVCIICRTGRLGVFLFLSWILMVRTEVCWEAI